MKIRTLKDCEPFVAGDGTELKELLNPEKEILELRYSLAHAVLAPGASSLPHRLRHSEVYYLLSGRGRMFIDDEYADVEEGGTIYIPPKATQWIKNTGESPLAFLCIVDPAWKQEDEVIL